ncbi:hypothetical protein L6164_013257 [Bauhinia variegata]|uniref:Uncharacterized protein n=1 Tax=Bauhinia variegata TaxID=167791 RepID=A0ACB9PCH3_BAUVA|nr:hypothetical protein L6164_013257 [Bauhinia variegata]
MSGFRRNFGARWFWEEEDEPIHYNESIVSFNPFIESPDGFPYFILKNCQVEHKGTKTWLWVSAATVGALFISCAGIISLVRKRRKAQKKTTSNAVLDLVTFYESGDAIELSKEKNGHDINVFSYASVMAATDNFSSENKLGEGGFGPVYKGKLKMGKEVAIKRLSKSSKQGGRRNNNFYDPNCPLNLVGYAWDLWKEGAGLEMLDPSVNDSFIPDQVLRCIHVALLCTQERPVDRPSMSSVLSMLTNENAVLPLLHRPAFYFRRMSNIVAKESLAKSTDSRNDLSVSDLQARIDMSSCNLCH